MKKRIVIALGGNALGDTPQDQLKAIDYTSDFIAQLVKQDNDVVLVHGNGPQVGMISSAFLKSHELTSQIPIMPLAESTAMSQGYIGFHIQQSLFNAFVNHQVFKSVATVITQVEVSPKDSALSHPTKPIGPFLSLEAVEQLKSLYPNNVYIEDSGRGYRHVVPSPQPQRIVEIDTVLTLLENNIIPIVCGGGGVPVIRNEFHLQAIGAVIDKDKSSALLAKQIKADILLIITGVDRVAIHFNTPLQQELTKITPKLALQYIQEGHFAPGSMLPKVEAAIDYIGDNADRKAIITSIEMLPQIFEGAGTVISI